MNPELKNHLLGTFRSIQRALLAWNWGEAAEHFHDFCERHREAIPDWYEDEFVFAAMKLWEADRQPQVLRHFAIFFDRALGETSQKHDALGLYLENLPGDGSPGLELDRLVSFLAVRVWCPSGHEPDEKG